jgi:hypothetical protein
MTPSQSNLKSYLNDEGMYHPNDPLFAKASVLKANRIPDYFFVANIPEILTHQQPKECGTSSSSTRVKEMDKR